jgi:hypothetical protein
VPSASPEEPEDLDGVPKGLVSARFSDESEGKSICRVSWDVIEISRERNQKHQAPNP